MTDLVRVYYLGEWVYASRSLAAELRTLEAAARAVPSHSAVYPVYPLEHIA